MNNLYKQSFDIQSLAHCRYLGETDTNGLPELADNYVEAKCPLAETLPTQLVKSHASMEAVDLYAFQESSCGFCKQTY